MVEIYTPVSHHPQQGAAVALLQPERSAGNVQGSSNTPPGSSGGGGAGSGPDVGWISPEKREQVWRGLGR